MDPAMITSPETPAETAPVSHDDRPLYAGLWRGVPREIGYLFIAFPLATVAFGVTLALFNAGVGTLITFFIGLILLIGGLYVARGFGTLELALLRWVGRPEVTAPDWQDSRARTGFFGWLRSVLGNGHYWLYLLWAALIDFVVSTVSWAIMIGWVATALGGVTYWFWQIFLPTPGDPVYPAHWLLVHIGFPVAHADPRAVDAISYLIAGLIFLATLPFVTRGLVSLHWLVAKGMLGAFRSEALTREVATLSSSRTAAVAAEGTALRRLERDIHDGPQQRLVRLQMDLAAAERQLDADPTAARTLLSEAMQQSKDALDELRALSRGFAPPLLLDRGLVAALDSMAGRSSIPVKFVAEVPEGTALPAELERNAYFLAVEAVTNAEKHSGAKNVTLRVWVRQEPDAGEKWLELAVSDDGVGGATATAGHGIAGLEERVHGLGGTLTVTSPDGGPTVVSAQLPFGDSSTAGKTAHTTTRAVPTRRKSGGATAAKGAPQSSSTEP
jgi:signal transduction histidine kinase